MNMISVAGFKMIDLFRKTNAFGLYPELIESQWLDKKDLRELQFLKLKKILAHSAKNVKYYRDIFASHQINVNDIQSFEDLKILPVVSKDDIRTNFEDFKADNFKSSSPRITQTGGSTGKPFISYRDKLSHSYLWANNFRGWNAAEYELGDKFIQIASGSLLPRTSSLKTKIYNYLQNAVIIPSYHLSDKKIAEILEKINSSSAKYIYGYSSTIYLIAEYGLSKKVSIRNDIKAIFTTSDMLYPSQREKIERFFSTVVFDIYGCPEGSILTFECEYHNGYHINQESVYIEIINEKDGLGNLISTTLTNYAFPLLRYNTGDVGSFSKEECKCGRGLNKISNLGGRIRDFIILRDGRYIHGAFFNHLKPLYDKSWIEQYQIVQENIDELTIKLKLAGEPVKEDLDKIESELKKGLLPDLKVNFDFDGVEYTGGGKFRLVVSKVKNEWEKV